MKYFVSFAVFVLVSAAFFSKRSNNIDNWEQLQSPPSKPIELVGVYPDLYWTIVIKSEDGKKYVNYGGKESDWISQDQSDFGVVPSDISEEYSMKNCNLDGVVFKKGVEILQCYQLRIQYPEAASNLTVILDKNGGVWQNNQWLGLSGILKQSVYPNFNLIFLSALILEIFWVVFIAIKEGTIQVFKNK